MFVKSVILCRVLLTGERVLQANMWQAAPSPTEGTRNGSSLRCHQGGCWQCCTSSPLVRQLDPPNHLYHSGRTLPPEFGCRMRQEGGVEAPRIQDISALRIGDQPPIGLQQGLSAPWHHPDTNSSALSLAAPIMGRHGASRVRGYNCGRLSFISDSPDTGCFTATWP